MASYRDLLVPRFVGLCSTLLISVHLITNIKERIEEKGRKVEVELDRYKNLDRTKSNFILQVTHELRGPVAAVSGYHEMILRGITGDIPDKTAETLKKADRRTENLLTIIDEMIDFAYMKSEEENRYLRSLLPLKEIMEENIRKQKSHARDKRIRLQSHCSKTVRAFANRDLINIILSNLINNAIKYSEPGTTIRIDAETSGDEVHLQVEDEGYGIEPEELDNIFEEFYRTRKARQIEKDGTGLGLPIVKRAVESLQGRITLQSELGKGTVFHIYLSAVEQSDIPGGGDA
jgi:signal transduction histidine kinase